VASSEALDVLHWAMHPTLHRCIPMLIKLRAAKNEKNSHFYLTTFLHAGISTFVIQKSTTMLADCKNTMNNGSQRYTMAAIVPQPWL
jgi:hypothetical protein